MGKHMENSLFYNINNLFTIDNYCNISLGHLFLYELSTATRYEINETNEMFQAFLISLY